MRNRDMIEWRDWPEPAPCGHRKAARWPYVVAALATMTAIGGAETPAPAKAPPAKPAVHTVIVHAGASHPWLTGWQAVALVAIVCATLIVIICGTAALRHVFGSRG